MFRCVVCFRSWVTWASKPMPSRPLKLNMFWWWGKFWVLPCPSIEPFDGGPQKLSCFDDDYVSGGVVFKPQNSHPAALKHMFWWWYAWGSHCLCIETHARLSWNKQCIYDFVIKIMLREIKHITYSVCLAQNRHLCMLQTWEFVAPILSFDSRMAYMDLAFHHKIVL
jgi:hypothetical protein